MYQLKHAGRCEFLMTGSWEYEINPLMVDMNKSESRKLGGTIGKGTQSEVNVNNFSYLA